MKKTGKPQKGELVIARITKIYPNSAQAELIEYGLSGMIHVSEIVRRWVRSIKEFIKEGQIVIAKVISVDDTIGLSIKQVERPDRERKLKEFKAERKAEKLLGVVAQTAGLSLDRAWQEIGFRMQEEFGSLASGFEIALKSPDLLTKKIGPKWASIVTEIAKKNYTAKEYQIRIMLKLICFAPNGIEIIKSALSKAKGFDIKYISAPNYMLVGKGTNYKELRARADGVARVIAEAVKPGEASWEILE